MTPTRTQTPRDHKDTASSKRRVVKPQSSRGMVEHQQGFSHLTQHIMIYILTKPELVTVATAESQTEMV